MDKGDRDSRYRKKTHLPHREKLTVSAGEVQIGVVVGKCVIEAVATQGANRRLLEKAFARVSALPAKRQNALAEHHKGTTRVMDVSHDF